MRKVVLRSFNLKPLEWDSSKKSEINYTSWNISVLGPISNTERHLDMTKKSHLNLIRSIKRFSHSLIKQKKRILFHLMFSFQEKVFFLLFFIISQNIYSFASKITSWLHSNLATQTKIIKNTVNNEENE